MDNSTFHAIRNRRTARHYSDREVPDSLIMELLELANRAPSGFNLQPWHFIVVRDTELKGKLRYVAMDQAQIVEAPATVVFVADPRSWPDSYGDVLNLGVERGALAPDRAAFYRNTVRLFYTVGPWGLFGPLKRLFLRLRSLILPTPFAISSRRDAVNYVRAQTMLSAATFMIAAKSAGLDSSPMEGFDERRLKQLLRIPDHMSVPIIVALGFLAESDNTPMSVRLPLSQKISIDYFGKA